MHRLDPRSKLLFASAYSILGVLFDTVVPLLVLLGSIIPLLAVGKILRKWLQTLKGLLFLLTLILIINTLVLSFSFAIAMILRVLVLMSAFSLFFLTVHPDDLALALVAMRVPYHFAFSLSLAFRFVPTLAREAQTIMDAQQSRGLELKEVNILHRVKNLVPIIIPLVVCSIRRAMLVAESLEARGFGASETRTSLKELHMTSWDWTFVVLVIVAFILGIVARVAGPALFPAMTYQIPL